MGKFDLPKPPINDGSEPKSEKKMIKVFCSACKKLIREQESQGEVLDISHGLCEKCAKEMEEEAMKELENEDQ